MGKVKKKNKLSLDHKLLILIILIAVSFVGFKMGVLLSGRTARSVSPLLPSSSPSALQAPRPPKSERTADLLLMPSRGNAKIGEPTNVSVLITKLPVQAVDVALNFDPEVFSVSQIVAGDLFPVVFRKRAEPGRIIFSAGLDVDNPEATATGKIFSFTLTPLTATEASKISFAERETIAALDGKNVLGKTNEAVFVVTQ